MGMKQSLVPKESTENGTETPSRSHKEASFLSRSPHSLHGMNFLTVLWAASLALMKSNTHFPLFTSLCTLHPKYLTSTSWFLINTVLERMPLLCNRFLSQKSHILPWDFLSRYPKGKLSKTAPQQIHSHLHSAQGLFNVHIKYNYTFTTCFTFTSQVCENAKNHHEKEKL